MARPGPVGNPKTDWIDVPDVPYDGPHPQLPKLPGRQRWLPEVVGWWEQVVQMPHCVLWGPTDWVFAIQTAYLYQDLYTEYHGGVAHSTKWTEVRRRDDVMGTTLEARRKLRIRYVPPPEKTGEGHTPEQRAAAAVEDEVAKARRRRIAEAS